tara:strand:- start:457 stop:738 length:282 start_codon:yes stop_codon:yes gene_type:complete
MVMRLIKKIKRFFFGIHEIIWVIVHEIENWLYPYYDRPVDSIFDEQDDDVDESSFIHSQLESANQRIERLQEEMIHVLNELNKIKRPDEDGKE